MKVKEHFTDDYIQQRINSVSWWHPLQFRQFKVKSHTQGWKLKYMPKTCKGKTVLDIGCKDGLYGFDAENKGAKRVVMIDRKLRDTLEIALELYLTNVEFKTINLYDLDTLDESFDIVFFMGIFYHLKYPMYGLQLAADKTKELMYFETHKTDSDIPIMRLYEKKERNKNPVEWWDPSIPCIYGMLRSVGFKKIKLIKEIKSRVLFKAWK
jgi:tRNA (mo5U34)-methyltransferase